MTAAMAIRRAHDAGVVITCNGKNLMLRASNPPSAELVDLLKQHKADIVTILETNSGQEADRFLERSTDLSISPASLKQERPKAVSGSSLVPHPDGESVHSSSPSNVMQGKHDAFNFLPPHNSTDLLCGGGQSFKGGEGGASGGQVKEEAVTSQAQEPDPNPYLPWPQQGCEGRRESGWILPV